MLKEVFEDNVCFTENRVRVRRIVANTASSNKTIWGLLVHGEQRRRRQNEAWNEKDAPSYRRTKYGAVTAPNSKRPKPNPGLPGQTARA